MNWQYVTYVIPLLVAVVVATALALFAWYRRPAPGATTFVVIMLAVAEWSLTYALELASVELPAKVFWTNAQVLGVVTIPAAWLGLALQFTGRDRWLTRRNLIPLTVEPLLTLLLVWTNEWHGLFRRDVRLNTNGPFPTLTATFGVWFWVNVTYSYLLLFLGTLLLLQALVRAPRVYRSQAGILLLGALVPWAGNRLYVFGLNPFPYLDLTPFAFTLSGLLMAWGLFRFRLLDLVPVARDAIVEELQDGVIVLDAQNRIVDLNPAAQCIVGRNLADVIGQSVNRVLPEHSELIDRCRDRRESRTEIVVGQGKEQRCYDVRLSSVYDQRGRFSGRVVVARDITDRKRVEEALRDGEARLRLMVDQMPAVVWTTDTDLRFTSSVGAGLEALNLQPNQVVGMTLFEYFQTDNPEFLHIAEHRNALRGESTAYEFEWAGNVYQTQVEPLRDAEGRIVGCVGLALDITERKRAEEERRVRQRHTELLNEITRAAIETSDFRTMLQLLADRMGELLDADGCYITLWDEEQQRAIPAAAYGPLREMYPTIRLEPGEVTMTEAVLRAGHPLVAEDVFNSPYVSPRIAAMFPSRSLLGLPLIADGQKLGAALIAFEQPHHFTSDEIARGEQAAQQIALAVDKARLLEKEREQRRLAEALHDVGLEMVAELDLDTLLRSIVARAIELLGGTQGGLYLYRPERDVLEWAMAIGMHPAPIGTTLCRGEGLSGKVWETGRPLIVDDYKTWEGRAPVYEGYPFSAIVAAPVRWGEEFLGVVNVLADPPRTFTPSDAELLGLFATQAAIALKNAYLIETARRRADEAETLRQAGAVVAATLEQDEAIRRILEQLRQVVPHDSASVQLLREGYLEIVGGRGWADLEAVVGLRFPVPADNPNTVVIQERRPYILGDAPAAYAPFCQEPHSHIRSFMGVPLIVHDRVIGMLALDSTQPHHFTPDHARLATAFANQVAIALENARLFEAERRRSRELETLRQASLHLTSTLELQPVLEAILDHTLMLVEANNAHIFLYDGERLTFGAALWADGRQATSFAEPRPEGLAYTVARRGERIVVRDINSHPLFHDWPWGGAIVGLPLRIGDRVGGG